MCGRRRQRRQPLVVSLGKVAYDMYQDRQNRQQTISGPSPPVATNSQTYDRAPQYSPAPRPYPQERGFKTNEKESFRVGPEAHHEEMNGEVLKTAGIAPPSYEDSVASQNRNAAARQVDSKQRPAEVPRNNAADDNGSDTSSVFETTGVMTPTTEMEAAAQQQQHQQQQQRRSPNHSDVYASARSMQSGDRAAPRTPNPQMEAAQISSIAHWLSQHDSTSELGRERQRELAREERDLAREERQLEKEISRVSSQAERDRDRHDREYQRRLTRTTEKLEALETKMAIKRAYRAEKRDLKAAYKAEKEAAKAQKAQYKAELKAWK